jgi:hypothetical protein
MTIEILAACRSEVALELQGAYIGDFMSPSRQQEKSHLKTGLVQDVLFSNNGY